MVVDNVICHHQCGSTSPLAGWLKVVQFSTCGVIRMAAWLKVVQLSGVIRRDTARLGTAGNWRADSLIGVYRTRRAD